MTNYKFRLSDIMPNTWFSKLKNTSKPNKKQSTTTSSTTTTTKDHPIKKQQLSESKETKIQIYPRKSYHFSRELTSSIDKVCLSPNNHRSCTIIPDSPRKSSKQRKRSKKTIVKSPPKTVTTSLSAHCNCRTNLCRKNDFSSPLYSVSSLDDTSPDTKPGESVPSEFSLGGDLPTESFHNTVSCSTSCSTHCRINGDFREKLSPPKIDDAKVFDLMPELELRPIVTKPGKFNDLVSDVKKQKEGIDDIKHKRRNSMETNPPLSVQVIKEEKSTKSSNNRNSVKKATSPGVKLRLNNSPRIANKKLIQGRRSISSSRAVVKSSFDPQRDFKESMVEMILEYKINESKDLEDLLASYLSLNSDEYHDIIIKVFKQIWFDLIVLG